MPLPPSEPVAASPCYLELRILLQQQLGRLGLQLPFNNSTFYLGEKNPVQFVSLQNSQLPVSLSEVFLLLHSQGPLQVLLLQAVQGPQEAAALSSGLQGEQAAMRDGHTEHD